MKYPILALIILLIALPALAANTTGAITPLQQRANAPDFTLTDVDGKIHRLSDYRGKVVIVNFWATWCPPCREEMPSMQKAWETLREKDVVMLAINIGENEDTIFQFIANYPVDFPLLMDLDSTVIGNWPVKGLPTTFIVDTQGRLAYRAIGGREWNTPDLLKLAQKLQGSLN